MSSPDAPSSPRRCPDERVAEFVVPIPYAELAGLVPPGGGPPPPDRASSAAALLGWNMERDDAPLLEYLWRATNPRRHLEFGTWRGFGATLCLRATQATVWTLNLFEGEATADGSWAYGERIGDPSSLPAGATITSFAPDARGRNEYVRTDAGAMIGVQYRAAGLGHRVCQVYCDTRAWDTSQYPPDFFDSVFIDGGHAAEIVVNDTEKALAVTRPGALFVWHDFCPVPEVMAAYGAPRGVVAGIAQQRDRLVAEFERLYWVEPSWMLVGIKRQGGERPARSEKGTSRT